MLKNYRLITEAQDGLLRANLSLTAKIPLPEDISAPGSRFRIITDREIEEMQNRVAQTKKNLDKDQQELIVRKKYISDLSKKLDEDKILISEFDSELQQTKFDVDKMLKIVADMEDVENQPPENRSVHFN